MPVILVHVIGPFSKYKKLCSAVGWLWTAFSKTLRTRTCEARRLWPSSRPDKGWVQQLVRLSRFEPDIPPLLMSYTPIHGHSKGNMGLTSKMMYFHIFWIKTRSPKRKYICCQDVNLQMPRSISKCPFKRCPTSTQVGCVDMRWMEDAIFICD